MKAGLLVRPEDITRLQQRCNYFLQNRCHGDFFPPETPAQKEDDKLQHC